MHAVLEAKNTVVGGVRHMQDCCVIIVITVIAVVNMHVFLVCPYTRWYTCPAEMTDNCHAPRCQPAGTAVSLQATQEAFSVCRPQKLFLAHRQRIGQNG